ncbi:lonely Cys domain-containing protein [Streptomyces bingchenggensis]|uniref:lonely Cys domain-containing protein n=1 Tax=Streptomyces bingchenggensis TaxID=379067 RepID=UPI00308272E4
MGGDKVPARFLPFLSVIPDVDEVWGYAWQMFNQAAAQPATKPPQLFKNMLPLPLRHALDSARRALRPDTRGFLDEDHDALSKLVHDELTALMRRYFRRYKPGEAVPDGFFDRAVGDMLSPREQVTAALTGRTSQGRQTTPSETLGMAEFPLDTDSARLAVALLLGEFRALAVAADGPLMTEEQIEQTDAELAALGERLYRRAVAASVPLPPEELRRSVQRILDNRVVRDFSRFLRLAVEGVPHVDGAPRRLLTVRGEQESAEALGLYALGTPLPTADPLYRLLAEVVGEASAFLANRTVPASEREDVSKAVRGAEKALKVLREAPTPPAIGWLAEAEIVALDGARVPAARVWHVKHSNRSGAPVGVSLRGGGVWLGRQESYGLLPEVGHVTEVRWEQPDGSAETPVVVSEGPWEKAPFGRLFLVGLDGDGTAAWLPVRSEDGSGVSGVAFSYKGVIDYLFARAPELTERSWDTDVLVAGADVAGPHARGRDPLEWPVAGQELASGTGFDGWLWASALGLEFGFASGVEEVVGEDGVTRQEPVVRLQLAEGDWLVGFPREPSSVQLAVWAERVAGDRRRAGDVLRWWRAVRLVYGPLLEDDKAAFDAVLRGFRALDEWRRARRRDASPLTWRRLRALTDEHFASLGEQAPPLERALPVLLEEAANKAGTELELHRFDLTPRYEPRRAWEEAPESSVAGRAGTAGGPGGPGRRGLPRWSDVLRLGSRSGGLRGGSPDAGVDPLAAGWPIGRVVTVAGPRSAALAEVPAAETSAGVSAGVSAGRGKGREEWFGFERRVDSRSEPLSYEVSDAGRVRLPGGPDGPDGAGRVLEPEGWRRFGADFLHEPSGALLYGDSGWIGRAANAAEVLEAFPTVPYTLSADSSGLLLVPDERETGATAVRIPLTEAPPTPALPAPASPRQSEPLDGAVRGVAQLPAARPLTGEATNSADRVLAAPVAPPAPASPAPETAEPPAPDEAAAERLLEALHGRDLRFRSSPFDVDVVARHVLRLPKDASVDQVVRAELFGLVRDAEADGRAGSLAALGAFHLERLGAAGSARSGHFTQGEHRIPGLNWLESDALDLDTDLSEVLVSRVGGSPAPGGGPGRVTPWPKGTRPYVVGGDGSKDGKVVVRLPDRSTLEVDVEEFVELVAADVAREKLPPGTPIVVAVPFLGRYGPLLQELADRTGLVVWPHSGEVKVSPLAGGKGRIDTVVGRPGVPKGAWFPLRPGQGPVLHAGLPDWYRNVVMWPMVSEAIGEQMGHSSFRPTEYAETFEANERHSDRMTTYVDFRFASETVSPEQELPRPAPEGSPFPEADALRISAHGIPGYMAVAVRSGDRVYYRTLDKDEAAAWVAWLVSGLPKDRWIDLACCCLASPKDSGRPDPDVGSLFYREVFVADPLRELSPGQRIVNKARRWARVSYGPQSEMKLQRNGKYVRTLFTDPQGRARDGELPRPDPEGAELDRLAVVARLHSGPGAVSAEVRERTLIAVRALKLMFGVYVEDGAGFGELLRGVAAVDEMWLADPEFRQVGPLTLDLLSRVIAAHAGAGVEVDQEVARRALAAAATAWEARPRGPRGERVDMPWDFVELPVVRLGAQWVRGDEARSEAATVLNLPEPRPLGEAQRLRMLWAWAKTMDLLSKPGVDVDDLAIRMLHLAPGVGVGESEREDLRTLLTRAFAVGQDASDTDAAAAYHLEVKLAFIATDRDTVLDGAEGKSRDFTGESWPRVNLAQIRTSGGLVDAPWRNRNRKRQATEPVPFLLRIEQDPQDPYIIELDIDGRVFRISVIEFLQLMANDPILTAKGKGTKVVLSHARTAPRIYVVAWLLAQGLGRPVLWTNDRTDLSGTDDQGAPVITVPAGAASAPVWQEALPEPPPPGTQNAPRPVPRPLPRSSGLPAPAAAPPAATTTTTAATVPSAAPAKLHGGPAIAPAPAPRVLGRGELEGLVDRVAVSVPSGGVSERRCGVGGRVEAQGAPGVDGSAGCGAVV